MRKLTIMRRKSFVGCAMKDQVYIRDEQTPEIVIQGVPCRKLGDIKNGEEKTFQIGEEEQQIFLIVDKISKGYCNASVTVAEGQEDVSLSGKHHFCLGSNPFRFDGVQLTAEEVAKQKANNRKGVVIMVAAVIIGIAVGLFLPGGFLRPESSSPKTFIKENLQITLTDAFEETQEERMFTCYQSKSVGVFVVREDRKLFGDITLEEYSNLVLKSSKRTDSALHTDDGFIWFDYTFAPAAEGQVFYYRAICYQGQDYFWVITFATPAANQDVYGETFMQWARSVKVG